MSRCCTESSVDAPTPLVETPAPFLAEEEPAIILPSKPVAAAPSGPAHSPRSLRLAKEFGYSQPDIDAMSPEQLDASVDQTNMFLLRQAREQQTRFNSMTQLDNVNRQPMPAPVPEPENDLLDEALYDAPLARAVNKTATENKQLKQQLQQITEREQQRTVAAMDDALDGAFEVLGKSHGHLFGTGPLTTLPQGAAEIQRRVGIIKSANLRNNDSPRVVAAKIKAAVELMYPVAPVPVTEPVGGYAAALAAPTGQQPARAERPRGANGQYLSEEEARWAQAGIARPTQRATAREPDGKAKAVSSVAQLLAERSQFADSADADQTLDDLFPDHDQR